MEENTQNTLRETIEASIAAVNGEQPEVVQTAESTVDRTRDEKGKFAKNEAKPEKISKESPVETVEVTPEPSVELQPIQRPSSWKKEMWPLWDKLTTGAPLTAQEARQVAEYNSQREQQFATGVSTYKQEAERAKPLLDAVAPFQADIENYNRTHQDQIEVPKLVNNLMGSHRTLSYGSPHEKLQLVSRLLNDYGIPLQAFYDQNIQQQYLNSAPARQQEPMRQPDIASLVNQALEQRELKQTVESMANNTEKYPFFQYVRNTMAQLLETGAATDLEDSYQQSLSVPEHSMLSTVVQQQQSQAEDQRKLEAQKQVAKVARANQISPKSATPIAAGANSKPSVRSALVEAMQAHTGGSRV